MLLRWESPYLKAGKKKELNVLGACLSYTSLGEEYVPLVLGGCVAVMSVCSTGPNTNNLWSFSIPGSTVPSSTPPCQMGDLSSRNLLPRQTESWGEPGSCGGVGSWGWSGVSWELLRSHSRWWVCGELLESQRARKPQGRLAALTHAPAHQLSSHKSELCT